MKAFVILAALACVSANPQIIYSGGYAGWPYGVQYTAAHPALTYSAPTVTYSAPTFFAPAFTKTQYHAQDELGQASYGYSHPGQAHAAVRDAFGAVRGSYAYIDPNGKEVRTNYIADHNGFRAESNALPVAPAVPIAPLLVGPSPVQDTPEVAEAKAAHQRAIEEAQARNAEADKKDAAEGIKPEDEENKKPDEEKAAVPAATPSRKKRALVYTSAPFVHHSVVAAPTLTYSAPFAPVATYYSSPVISAPAYRTATLTKVVNNPGHSYSYRVDK